jgi:hypothetical protein
MDTHPAAIVTSLWRHFHAIDPPREVRKIVWAHHGRVCKGTMQTQRELLLGRREVLDAGEGVLVRLRLGKCQVDVVRPGLEIAKINAILDQLVCSFVEIEELIHLLDGRHSSEGRQGE